MSTAIALQDVHSASHSRHDSVVRQRNNLKTKESIGTSVADDDPWLKTPHDIETSELRLDSKAFTPTSTYWISLHGILSKNITILDLSKDISVTYSGLDDTYKEHVQKALKDHSYTPAYTCHRNNWLGLQYKITAGQDDHIADWKHPWSSVGEATLTFPEDSPHSSHPIILRNKRWGLRTECFTVESQPFYWEMDGLWHSTYMTLFKVTGTGDHQTKVEVAKYAQKWWGAFVTGGTLVVDEKQIDGCIACLTLCVVLKKKRQRAAERHSFES